MIYNVLTKIQRILLRCNILLGLFSFLWYDSFDIRIYLERTHLCDTELNATRAYYVIICFHCFKQSHVIVFEIRQGLKYIICLFRFQRDSSSRIMLLNKKDNHYMLEYVDAYMHMKFCKIENKNAEALLRLNIVSKLNYTFNWTVQHFFRLSVTT